MTRGALCIVLLGAGALHAAPFADPTRPPGVRASEELAADSPSAPSGRLESVLIAPDRRIAVIGGQAFKVGDKYGEGQVVRITEGEVTIRRAEGSETLRMFPEVQKTPRAASAKRATR